MFEKDNQQDLLQILNLIIYDKIYYYKLNQRNSVCSS